MNYVLDTNILIYAIDERDTKKAAIAKKLLEHAVRSQGNIPRQVLGELLNLGHKRAGLMLDNTRTVARLLEASIRLVLDLVCSPPFRSFRAKSRNTAQRPASRLRSKRTEVWFDLIENESRVIDTDGPAMRSASELAEHHKLQYFDALICTIAR